MFASHHDAMGWVRTPPSESARDVAVVPLGATKTVYLIRHAEGFHNEGASSGAREEFTFILSRRGTFDRKLTTRATFHSLAQRVRRIRGSTGTRRTRTRA